MSIFLMDRCLSIQCIKQLKSSWFVVFSEVDRFSSHHFVLRFQFAEREDTEDKLKLQLSEMEEENEVMEFRVLELEDANEKVRPSSCCTGSNNYLCCIESIVINIGA